jgi:hypothetical protein
MFSGQPEITAKCWNFSDKILALKYRVQSTEWRVQTSLRWFLSDRESRTWTKSSWNHKLNGLRENAILIAVIKGRPPGRSLRRSGSLRAGLPRSPPRPSLPSCCAPLGRTAWGSRRAMRTVEVLKRKGSHCNTINTSHCHMLSPAYGSHQPVSHYVQVMCMWNGRMHARTYGQKADV